MSEDRVTVWVQRFKDRSTLMLQWLDPVSRKRKSESTGTSDPEAAERARADKEYELSHGLAQERSRMTWAQFRERFEEQYVSPLRQNTQANYQRTFDLFEELVGPHLLRSVNEQIVSSFATTMRRRPTRGRDGMQPSTIRVYLEFLHVALTWAAEQKYLPTVPKFPVVKVPRRKPQPIPAESFERLFAKAPDQQTQVYLLCGWLAGLRLTEALCLEWAETDKAPWVEMERNRIWLPADFSKSTEDQWIPLDPVLRQALAKLPRHGRQVFRFISRRTGRQICAEGMSQRIVKLAKKAGVKLSMHSLRKGFGCRYAGKVPAQVLQRLMRHSSISTTMDYYANIDAAVEEAVLGQCNTSRNNASSDVHQPAKTSAEVVGANRESFKS